MKVGEWRVMASSGRPVRVMALPDPPREPRVVVRTHGWTVIWTPPERVGELLTREALAAYEDRLNRDFWHPDDVKGLADAKAWLAGVVADEATEAAGLAAASGLTA